MTEEPAKPSRKTRSVPRGTGSLRRASARARSMLATVLGPLVRLVWRVIRPYLLIVSPVGWLVALAAAIALLLSVVLGWQEFFFLGATLLASLVVAVSFVFGRATYGVGIELNPRRVVVGDRALGRMIVTNAGAKNLLPTRMELPVGAGLAEFGVPALSPKEEHEELFAVPTQHRAVIVAGPAVSVRGDQLGLLRRTVRWTDPIELFVHPVTTHLASSAAGLVRDLEGQVSKTITDNDISFHALRAYVPGDDRRYVHWRTSARTGQLMVRQFQETRRSQLTMIHSALSSYYASDEEFELAVSVTASIAAQVIRDGTQLSVVTETQQLRTHSATGMLDDSCRITPVSRKFDSARLFAREVTKRLPAPSVVMVVAGSQSSMDDYRSVESLFNADTVVLAFRVEAGAKPKVSFVSGLAVLTVGALTDLPALMRQVGQ